LKKLKGSSIKLHAKVLHAEILHGEEAKKLKKVQRRPQITIGDAPLLRKLEVMEASPGIWQNSRTGQIRQNDRRCHGREKNG
jgi:hypothetical protein